MSYIFFKTHFLFFHVDKIKTKIVKKRTVVQFLLSNIDINNRNNSDKHD